ncbi:MAG: ribbon-helix-helix domain-containing protein [Rhizobiales bacterium]|nr:ribbon-helix-helix domain-containing protein [Hyphomicrobiales bacterium]
MGKRSVRVAGHPTSVSLEDEFWDALADIARARALSVTKLIDEIDAARGASGLSSAIRLFVLAHYRKSASD